MTREPTKTEEFKQILSGMAVGQTFYMAQGKTKDGHTVLEIVFAEKTGESELKQHKRILTYDICNLPDEGVMSFSQLLCELVTDIEKGMDRGFIAEAQA